MLETWGSSGDVVRRAEGSPSSPVTPELVLEGLRLTVNKYGPDVGRAAFAGAFPGLETHFDSFFRSESSSAKKPSH